jgi:hypothetical protein
MRVSERKRQQRRLTQRPECNIKIVLTEIGWRGKNWNNLAQDRDQWWALVNIVINRTITNLDIIHRPVFYLNTAYRIDV